MNFEGQLKRTPPVCPNRACVPINLFKFIIREDSVGPKRLLAATAQLAEFPHVTEYVGGFLATPILTTKVHVLDLLVHILTNLVLGVSVVPQVCCDSHCLADYVLQVDRMS